MDELKDFMDIKIATRCPLCGKRFKDMSIDFIDDEPVWVNSKCDCGLSLEMWLTNKGEATNKWDGVVSK